MANGNGNGRGWTVAVALMAVLGTGSVIYFSSIDRIAKLPTREEVKEIVRENSVTPAEARTIASEVVRTESLWGVERSGFTARLTAEERATVIMDDKLDDILDALRRLEARYPE